MDKELKQKIEDSAVRFANPGDEIVFESGAKWLYGNAGYRYTKEDMEEAYNSGNAHADYDYCDFEAWIKERENI